MWTISNNLVATMSIITGLVAGSALVRIFSEHSLWDILPIIPGIVWMICLYESSKLKGS